MTKNLAEFCVKVLQSAMLGLVLTSSFAHADALHEQSVRLQVQVDGAQDKVDAAKQSLNDAKKEVDAAIKAIEAKAKTACDALVAAAEKAPKTPPNPGTEGQAPAEGGGQAEAKPKVKCAEAEAKETKKQFFEQLRKDNAKVPEPYALGAEQTEWHVAGLCGTQPQDGKWPDECKGLVDKALNANATLVAAKKELDEQTLRLTERQEALEASVKLQGAVTEMTPGASLSSRLRGVRKVRCMTAYCWGGADGSQYAVEPIVDLPIGLSWAVGNGGLANYVNANRIDVSVSAGIRVWLAYDVISVGVLIARPSLTNTSRIYADFSDKSFSSNSVSRPYPTLALGFWGDIFALTISYDQLRNTDGSDAVDPRFRPNEVLSRTFVFGISINTITAARNAIGASMGDSDDE